MSALIADSDKYEFSIPVSHKKMILSGYKEQQRTDIVSQFWLDQGIQSQEFLPHFQAK